MLLEWAETIKSAQGNVEQLKEYELDSVSKNEESVSLLSEQENILKILFSSNDGVEEKSLAQKLGIDMGSLNYHTDELLEKGFIEEPGMTIGNSFTGESGYFTHYISKNGRKHVVESIGI
mgnify:CR=1 FL=1